VVVVLVRIEVLVRTFRVEAPRFADGAVGALERARQDELRAKRPKDELTFAAGVFRDAQLYFVALGRTDHGVRDTGITGGRIENRLATVELARGFPVSDHPRRGPVFHGSAGVLPFSLGVDLDVWAFLLDLT